MQSFFRFCRTGMLLLCCFSAALFTKAQTTSNAPAMSGFSVQESVSMASVYSGQTFTYTTTFTLPAGATNFTVSAYLPNTVTIDNVVFPASYSGNVPTFTTLGSTVRLTFASPIVGNISGSFQVNVHFPYLHACTQDVRANAEIKGDSPNVSLVTSYILTHCIVDKTWAIDKYSRGTTYVGPNYAGTACDYATLDSIVEYGIKMNRSSSQILGSYTLTNPQLFDSPSNGGYISSITFTTANLAGTTIIPGGFGLVLPTTPTGLDPTNYYEIRFKVTYPGLAINTCTANTAQLTGKTGCGLDTSFQDVARVIRLGGLPDSARLIKQVFPEGNLPGCGGTYRITVVNYGSSPINYHLIDTFPPCLTNVTSMIVPGGGSSVTLGAVPPYIAGINGVNLAGFGASHVYTFHYIIGSGCTPPGFTNTVRADSGFIGSSSAGVAMLPPDPKPCITKTICAVPGGIIHIGDTVRFRIRVQNIGGSPIIGAIIRDSLDEANLEYLGNEMHYSYPNASNISCKPAYVPGGAQPWGTPNGTHTTGLVTWNADTIPVECANVLNVTCGGGYYLPAYYIEFDVRIRDTAGIGNILNKAVLSNAGPDVVTFTSFVTNGFINYNVQKDVSKDNASYGGTVSVPAGSTVYYRLRSVNTGMAIRDAVLLDLLPKDRAGGDSMILPSGLRSPAPSFNVRYNAAVSSTHTSTADSSSTNLGISTLNELGVTSAAGPAGWTPGLSVNAADIKTRLTQPIGLTPLNYIFSAKVAADAKKDDVACNTYAMRGRAKYLTNYVINYIPLTPIESPKACVTSTGGSPCCEPYAFTVPTSVCVGDSIKFCVKDSCKEGSIFYEWHFNDGGPLQTGECVSHVFAAAGTYALVIVWKNECGVGRSQEYIIEAKKCCCEPYDFVIPTSVCVGDSINFCVKDSCKEGDIKYEWHFNDGGPLQYGNCVSHVFAAEGTYALVIVWKNNCGVGHSQEYIIEAKKCCCEPNEFVIPERVCLGTPTQFCAKDSCKEGDIKYYWHFGDGSPVETGECVTHSYGTPGSYTVVVTWKNKCGQKGEKEYKIEVKECPCKIQVSFVLTTSGLHLLADGTSSTSSQPIALYVWDYGDGTYGTGPVTNHTYATDGDYIVTLTVYSMNEKGEICECRDKCSTRIRVDRRDREGRRWYCGDRSEPQNPEEPGKKADEITMNATPNPFRDRISVSFVTAKADPKVKTDIASQSYTLTFLGTDGTVMQTRTLSGLRSTVNFQTAHYSAGMYYLMLRGTDGKVRSVKVVKID